MPAALTDDAGPRLDPGAFATLLVTEAADRVAVQLNRPALRNAIDAAIPSVRPHNATVRTKNNHIRSLPTHVG